jgi:hypothetical protein
VKSNAHQAKSFKFSADLYTFTTTTDASGGEIRNYVFARSVTLRAQTGPFGKMAVFFDDADDDLTVGNRLHNFLDAGGVELQRNAVWELDQFQPNLNMWGRREGFVGRVIYVGVDA